MSDRVLLVLGRGGARQGDGVAADGDIEIGNRGAVLENRFSMREIECVDIGVDADLVDDVDICGSELLSAFIKAALADSSGKSPLSVMLLPLLAIESGAEDNCGAPDLLDGASVPFGPSVERARSNAP